MPGPNTTGTANTADYNLGRGILYFASPLISSLPVDWRDLGNCPEFNLSIEVETLEHQSSRAGLKTVDKDVVISQKATVSFGLDELNHENMAAFLAGAKVSHTNVAVAGFSSRLLVPAAQLALGRWYDLTDASGERAYDVVTSDVIIKNSTDVVTMVDGTDYTLDTEMGRFFVLSTSSAMAAAIAAVEGLNVTLSAEATASDVDEVQGLTTTSVVGALKFVAENPANADAKTEYHFHQISLKAEGDLSLIGDDYSVMNFTGTAEKNTTADAASPTMVIRNVQA